MELLRLYLSRVRIPELTNRVYKQECCISFDTPKSEGGLFVDMNSFLAFGKDYVVWNYEKTGNAVYLHIKETQKPVPEDRPLKRRTLLAIGGVFDYNAPEFEESYEIVILPDYVTFPFPSVELPEKVRLAADAVIMSVVADKKEQVAALTADTKLISKHAMDLKQLDNGIVVPPSGWKCEKCDKMNNLWLNLTDGSILCGRRNWNGSDHYKVTKYPLAVKLGTITADLEAADIYCYDEDESVLDPFLAQHLLHFGIDFSSLQKTEITTAERELDEITNFDWNRIQGSGQEVVPLFGPGYTGLVNLGSCCYLAAIMQVVFSTRGFCSRYYLDQSLKVAFDMAPSDPTVDLNMQLTKLAHGLLSGKYSTPAIKKEDAGYAAPTILTAKQEGIAPRMFESVIAARHPEFLSMREGIIRCCANCRHHRQLCLLCQDQLGSLRCDALELGRSTMGTPSWIRQGVSNLESKSECSAKSDDEIVRLRIPLMCCLDSFSAPEELNDFYCTALNNKTTAIKTAGLASFPDYLVLHLRKFVLEDGWVPKKLDIYIDVPDTIGISSICSKGLQPGEELLPDCAAGDDGINANKDIVNQLISMGFHYLHCQKAAINTSNSGVEEAMNWLLDHMNDPDIDEPIRKEHKNAPFVDPSKVDIFEEEIARKALQALGGDIEKAAECMLNPSCGMSNMDTRSSGSGIEVNASLPDGQGRYRLIRLVSHLGRSTQWGHYVAHILKDGRWVV